MRLPLHAIAVFSLLAVPVLLGFQCTQLEPGLRAGTCLRDITPVTPSLAPAYQAAFGHAAPVNHTDPVYLAGFGGDRRATGYHDRLWARGVVLDGPGGRIAVVALDLVGYFSAEVETIRGLVAPESAVDYLVVHSTHQHEGPDTLGIWGPTPLTSGIDMGYLDFVNDAVASCVDEAVANLEVARVRYATAHGEGLSLGVDAEDDGLGVADGKVLAGDDLLAPATGGRIVDPRIAVMHVRERSHPFETLATLVNFASHPESLGSNNTLVTSDFPHYVRERIESQLGGLAIWVSGDLGVLQGPLDIDVLDPATGLPAPRRTFRFAEVHGAQIADRVVAHLDVLTPAGDATPDIAFGTVRPVAVPLANPFFRFFIAGGVLNTRGATLFTNGVPDPALGQPFPPPFQWIPQALGEDVHTEVGAFRVGEASFGVVPTELDPQIGEAYRAEMQGAAHTFLIGLGNDEIGYQVPVAKFDSSCQVCAPYALANVIDQCPLYPNIDCSTVFQNNVGPGVDPAVSAEMIPLLQQLH